MRIGPKMRLAAQYVARNEGCAIRPVAQHVGPRGSLRYGYAAVHRAITAGLIRYRYENGRYALFAAKGEQ